MGSCTLVHPCRRSELRSCGYNVEQFSELRQDILVDEILLRLPVKSLVRFKVVCKFWAELVRLVGCCNGIVCLSLTRRHHSFALWNPATTEYRLIYYLHPSGSNRIYAGFFFDSVADSCKLVRVTFSKPEKSVSGIFSILTLNDNNKWRNKELPVPRRIPGRVYMSPVTCLKTCMYWIVKGSHCHRNKYILCLDIVDEVFKHIIEFPSADHLDFDTWLFNYKGSLAMFVRDNFLPSYCFDVWVLNDDCGGNWHKQLTLRLYMPQVKQVPLGFISNKEGNDLVLLYTSRGMYLLWDTDSGETVKVISGNCKVYQFFLYSESFASVY